MATPPPPTSFAALARDPTTLASLASTVAILLAALALSRRVLDPASTPPRLRALFVWHAFDALIHFILEGSFVYHCLFTSAPVAGVLAAAGEGQSGMLASLGGYWPDPRNFLGGGLGGGDGPVVHGSQAGGENPLAKLWMVYAKADVRWAGVDLVCSFFFFFFLRFPPVSVIVYGWLRGCIGGANGMGLSTDCAQH